MNIPKTSDQHEDEHSFNYTLNEAVNKVWEYLTDEGDGQDPPIEYDQVSTFKAAEEDLKDEIKRICDEWLKSRDDEDFELSFEDITYGTFQRLSKVD